MKRRRKKNKLKKISIKLFSTIVILILIKIILFPTYGYSIKGVTLIIKNNLYSEIKKDKTYSKTLEEVLISNKYNNKYYSDYLNITYIDDKDFIDNINKLLKLGYSSKDINIIYDKTPTLINDIIEKDYNENLANYISLDYFNSKYLDRYLDYDINKVTSVYDITDIKNNYSYEDTVTFVNANLDKEYFSDDNIYDNDEVQNDFTVLVNKYNKLNSNYEPNDLVIVDKSYATGTQKLRKEANDAFIKMAKAMKEENLKIYAGSTYRSYTYQQGLYNRYVASDGFDEAETFSARAGYSEHQLGLAIDIISGSYNYLSEDDEEYDWLINNSYKYGYILRYPRGKEYITGYMFEDWHFRYLGVELATKVYESGLAYEEYIARNLK